MFLVEEKENGPRRAEIYMREDGLFEGRIYHHAGGDGSQLLCGESEFEVCGVTETLSRVETLVDEELGL